MNLRNFDFNSITKFIYKLESNDKFKNNLESFLQNLDQGKMSTEFSDNISSDVANALTNEGNDKIGNATEKSREILTSLGKNQLIDDLVKERSLFEENADPKRIQEFFQKHLQRNNFERLSDDEWKNVMSELSPEIGDLYLQASQEYQKQKFPPEMVNDSLKKVLKNGQELEKIIYQKGLRSPDEIMDFIRQNPANLPKEIQEAFSVDNPELEDFIKNEAALDLAGKFERREKKLKLKEGEVSDLVNNFSREIIGTKNWENLSNDELNSLWIEKFKEVDFNGFVGYAANGLIGKLRKTLKQPLDNAKSEVFKAQTKVKKQEADKLISSVLKENSAKKLSPEDLNKIFEQKLGDLNLFDNLPEKSDFRKDLYEQIKKSWETKSEEFLSNEKSEETEENSDKISRNKMKESWISWVSHLKNFDQDFKNSRDFQKAFIAKYFSNNPQDAENYFKKHPNYAKSFEKSFSQYEQGQESFFNSKIDKVAGKLSDSRVASALRASFKKARNNGEKRGWLSYLDSHVGEYEKSIQNSAKLENRLNAGLAKLKNHPQIGKIRDNFNLIQKNRKFLNGKGQYISPRNYEADLQKIEAKFSGLEKQDKLDRAKAEKDIAALNPAKFAHLKLKSKEDLAKRTGIKMPEYLWKEFGQEQFWNKVDQVYSATMESKEGSLEKSLSVKFAKETIKSLSHKDLDFSRDFPSQQSFNRQRHLRNQVSFSDEVWEQVKDDFYKKSEKLYTEHQKTREEIKTLSRGISALKAGDLDFSKDYKNLAEFSHQAAFFEFFKNQKVSNIAYDQIKNSEFTPKVIELYGEYLKQKNGLDSSPETAESREIIDNLKISDLDISQDFASFSEFKRQPYLQKTVSFDAETWEKVQPNFEQKALQLYSEHLQIKDEQQKFEKALSTLTTEDLETDYESFSEFVHQPAMREFFTELNISDLAYDSLTDDFAGKMNELWESVKNSNEESEFDDKDMQKIGTKHGLDFFNLPLDNRENLGMKFERLDKLLTKNTSLANFMRKQEEFILPIFLGVLGEMTSEDMTRLEGALGTSEKTSGEIVDIFFNSPRQKYLLSEVRKKDSDAWKRLEMAERNYDGELDIRVILTNSKKGEDLDEEFAELELDEDGNPIIENEEDELDEKIDSNEEIAESDESGELLEENIDDVVELDDEEIEEENEAKSREILEKGIESKDKDEKLDSVENIAESDETDDMVDEEIISDEENEDNLEESEEISRDSEIPPAPFAKGEQSIDGNDIEQSDLDSDEEIAENNPLTTLSRGRDIEQEDLEEEIKLEEDEIEENEEISRDSAEEKIPPAPFAKGEKNIEQEDLEEEIKLEEDEIEENEEISRNLEESEIQEINIDLGNEKEKQEELEKEEEKLNAQEQEVKSREKILENIKKENLKQETEKEMAERLAKEQEILLRILQTEKVAGNSEKEGSGEVAEDGDEDSLAGNVQDDLLQGKSPVNFAEIHCSGTMNLANILAKVQTYLELLAEKDIKFQINLSEKESLRETRKSREIFLSIVDFLMQKEVYALQKVMIRPQNFAGNSGLLRINAQYLNDLVSQKIQVELLER